MSETAFEISRSVLSDGQDAETVGGTGGGASRIAVTAVPEAKASPDGAEILVGLTRASGESLHLALPLDQASALIAKAAQAADHARRIQTGNEAACNVFAVSWWEVHTVPGTPQLILKFTTPEGGPISVVLHRDAATQMRETLQAAAGYDVSPATPAARH